MKLTEKSALLFVVLTVVLDSIGLGIIMPVLPQLISELTGETLSDASRYGGMLMFAFAAMQFLFSPIVGALSDRFGRRPVMLVSLLIYGLDYILMAFAPTLAWLFIGRILSGVTGATYSTANAYIADVSPPKRRSQNFGMTGAAFGIGFILGPMIGGVLGEYGPRTPFFAAAGFALLNTLFGFFVMRESLSQEKRRVFSWARANPIGALRQLRAVRSLKWLAIIWFLSGIGHHVWSATWSFFTMEKFSWGPREIGLSLTFVGLSMAVVQGYLTRIVIPRIGAPKAMLGGLIFSVAAYAGAAFVDSVITLYGVIALSALAGFVSPALQGMMSERVDDNAQGELQGALSSLSSLTAMIGPVVMTQLFAYFTSEHAPIYFPGASFIAATVLSGACLVILVPLLPSLSKRHDPESSTEPEPKRHV